MLITRVWALAISGSRACFLSKWSSLWVMLRCQRELWLKPAPFNRPPAWPPAQEGRMWWFDAKWVPRLSLPSDPLNPTAATPSRPPVSAPVSPATSSQFANMSLIWLACHTQMSQWREINLCPRRCQACDSCGLRFHSMSAVANLWEPWTDHPLHALHTHTLYFLNIKLIRGTNQD